MMHVSKHQNNIKKNVSEKLTMYNCDIMLFQLPIYHYTKDDSLGEESWSIWLETYMNYEIIQKKILKKILSVKDMIQRSYFLR